MLSVIAHRIVTVAALLLAAAVASAAEVTVGAARAGVWQPLLAGKRIALYTNHTGLVGAEHTLDIMRRHGLDVKMIFSPEHGFRGTADAGEHVVSGRDAATGLPIVSLYGANRYPSAAMMDSVDVIVTDIQDVGTRFYTYYCTMLDLMNSAAAAGKEFVVLDRPNPNGMTVDGPVLDMRFQSGVGRLPIPVAHGMTLGELARMIVGEGWLKDGRGLALTVVECTGYTHATRYRLPVAPSPNLPDMLAVYLYPSMCFFEATPLSLGRGTDRPFTRFGHPALRTKVGYPFRFIPQSRPGAKKPPLMGVTCWGRDLSGLTEEQAIAMGVDLTQLIDAVRDMGCGTTLLTKFFEKLIGTDRVRAMIGSGATADEIRASWQPELERFKARRAPYLLYPLE